MGRATRQILSPRFPGWTLALIGCALGVYVLPGGTQGLIYDRQAILAGEWWRLFSAHLVHFTPQHLGVNLLAVAVAGGLIERRTHPGLPLLLLGSALMIGPTLLVLEPQMAFYGGLSGIAMAEVVFLCWLGREGERLWRQMCLLVLAVLLGKTLWELVSGGSLLAVSTEQPFMPVPLAHLVGGLVGLGTALGWHKGGVFLKQVSSG